MRVSAEVADEVCSNAHDNNGRDEVQHVVDKDEGTVHLVRTRGRRTIIGCGVCASHCCITATSEDADMAAKEEDAM